MLIATTFWDVFWWLIIASLWVMYIWVFIALFGDIFRRRDLSGGAKALWILLLFVLPLLGALIYVGSRPKQPVEAG